ncbi:MAG: GTPase ObgE [Rikenellaceae bacterium]
MASSNFVDYVKIFCRSGNGGGGSVHFRREKFVEFGGPDGGDGGRGGHIILRGNSNFWTLIHLKYQKHILGNDGGFGSGARCHGKDGEDIIIDVPLGTVAKDAESMEQLCEVTEDGQQIVLCKGGHGGKGNWNFKTATNQAPRYASPGGDCVEGWFVLELKILADVGLVGFPNAGKSTLLSVISAARPKIANYAFTTLEPNLGIVSYRDYKSFVMADIPGIIEGAHAGKGLGVRFLRHIERNSVLLFMVAADAKDIVEEFNILLRELRLYNGELMDKNRVLAITKCDMLDDELMDEIRLEIKNAAIDIPLVFISSVSNYNLQQLKDELWNALHR